MGSELLLSDRIYYPDGDKNFLLWSLIPYLLAWSEEGYPDKIRFDEVATIRKDGGKNIALASIVAANGPKPKYYDSLKKSFGPMWNGLRNEEENILLWQINTEWSNRVVTVEDYSKDIGRDLKLLYRFTVNKDLSIDEYAYMVQKGYIRKVDDKFELAIVWLKEREIVDQLLMLCNGVRMKYKEELEQLRERYCKAVIENKPKQVEKMQAYMLQHLFFSDSWFLLYTLKELVGYGKLKPPLEHQRISLSTVVMPNK